MERSSGNPGRARGRAGSNNTQGNSGGRGRRPGQTSQPPGGLPGPQPAAPVPFAWGNPNAGGARGTSRGGAVMSAAQPTTVAQQRPPAPVTLGRATTHRDVPVVEAQGAVAVEESRGVVRGRRVITELVRSRPQHITSKCGTSGKKLSVRTNYFRVLKMPKWSIHQFRVDFSPDVDMIRLRRAYLAEHRETFGGYIFDGTLLFCTNFFMNHADNGQKEFCTKNAEGQTIQIKIKHVGVVDVTDAQLIQVLNLILRRAMQGLKLELVGRNYFDAKEKIPLHSHKMELWPGYQTSIRQHERDILLCAEITHKVMRTETLLEIFHACTTESADHQNAFKQLVIGTIVLTDYNNKTYRVDDVDFAHNPKSTFESKGKKISYEDYYRQRYNLKVIPTQPLLVSRPSAKDIRGGQIDHIMLIPQLCRATGLTDSMRNNFTLMRDMGAYTRINPGSRIERLMKFNQRLLNNVDSMGVFALWNMQLDTNLVEVPGRKLEPEKIVFGNNKKITCDANADWTREFRKNTMYTNVDIKRWHVIHPGKESKAVNEFVKMCINAAASMGMHISPPIPMAMNDDRVGTYSHAIDKATSQDPQILMLVLTGPHSEKYGSIKKKCCVDRPVPSQVCTLRTINPRGNKAAGLMSIATKIVIQMNAKLMGAPWLIDLPLSGLMTVGFDVCHSVKEKRSYGALVATMDIKTSSKYFSAVSSHVKGVELSNEISLKMTCALKAYRATHGTLPDRILFFRDGVGDSQLNQVFNTEVSVLKAKLDEIYKSAGFSNGCRLAFIVVSKRINTRYFVNDQNPQPGTIVDDVITLPERYDFFLVSQSVRQGTVSPTSYNVIFDNFGLNPDKIQILTYKMTHLYYNWSGTLRVPAVCQYAHKLAFLVAESINRAPNNVLENQLYFL